MINIRYIAVFLALFLAGASHAALKDKVDAVLVLPKPPSGIVFEVISGDADFLEQAIPAIREQSARLRRHFNDLPIAVVTHGGEQFALMAAKADDYASTHKQVKVMSLQENIPVHVCGTHASWRNVVEEDFPEYVDVAPSGPAQIRNYMELGYLLIEVDLD